VSDDLSDGSDDFLQKGFLGESAKLAIPALRRPLTSWFELVELVSAVLQTSLLNASRTVRGTSKDPAVLGTFVAFRSAHSLQAAILLAERGLITETRLLVRSLIENAFCMAALVTNPQEFLARFEEDAVASRKGLAGVILKKEIASPGSPDEAKVKAALVSFGKAKLMSIDDLADLGPLRKQYLLYRVISNDAAHPSATSLSRHMDVKPDKSGWIGYVSGPALEPERRQTLNDLALTAISIVVGFTELIADIKGNAEISELSERYQKLRLA